KLINLGLWVMVFALGGKDFFVALLTKQSVYFTSLFIIGVIQFFAFFWTVFLLVTTLSEIQKFSVWRAFLSAFLAWIFFIIVSYLISYGYLAFYVA
ncbi:MAG TPA: hypothetical protein P5048_03240, partial [Chlamydiales bacterium]|nr:hypothetical protein [Chlamydiales bacterium]